MVTRQKGCEMYYYTDNKATKYGITCWPQAIDMHDATVMSHLATELGIGFFLITYKHWQLDHLWLRVWPMMLQGY